jgi:hypothetical protein
MNEMSMEQWRNDAGEEKGKKSGEKPGQVFLRALGLSSVIVILTV